MPGEKRRNFKKVVNRSKGAPDQIVKRITLFTIDSSMSRFVKCNTYQGKRKKGKSHFPQIQLQSDDSIPLPEFNSKIKGSI